MSYLSENYDDSLVGSLYGYRPKTKKHWWGSDYTAKLESVPDMMQRIAVSVLGEDAAPEKLDLMARIAFAVADRTSHLIDLSDPAKSVMQLDGWVIGRYALGHEDTMREILLEIGVTPEKADAKLAERPPLVTDQEVEELDRRWRAEELGITDYLPSWRELWNLYAEDPEELLGLDDAVIAQGEESMIRSWIGDDMGIKDHIPSWPELQEAYRKRGEELVLTKAEKRVVAAFRKKEARKPEKNQTLRAIIASKSRKSMVFPRRN